MDRPEQEDGRVILAEVTFQPPYIADAIADIFGQAMDTPATRELSRIVGMLGIRPRGERLAERARNLSPQVRRILERDGPNCWFCGDALGDDITREHKVSKADRGGDEDENIVLDHHDCNSRCRHLRLELKLVARAEAHRLKGNPL